MTVVDTDALAAIFSYLDDLRESGETNMFGAAPYVSREFDLDKSEARNATLLWMTTFDGQLTPMERAKQATGSTHATTSGTLPRTP